MNNQPPITDSPWFWFALFPAVGLTALLATGGKFGNRQASIERKGQAHAAIAEGSVSVEVDAKGQKSATGVPKYSQPGRTKVQLLSLSILLGVICATSLGLLVRERWRLVARE
ncbi:MAG: hypothetical protein GXP26_05810 [Planctomycetes bacterium]|nr:hypothetical protein [Planctomycetota bacterium]